MLTATEITAEEVTAYGDVLIRLVTEARTAEPARFAPVTNWTTLHEVCDANEFVIDADTETGTDDLGRSVNLFNGCVARVELALWPTGRTVIGHDGVERSFDAWCKQVDALTGYADVPANARPPREEWQSGVTPAEVIVRPSR